MTSVVEHKGFYRTGKLTIQRRYDVTSPSSERCGSKICKKIVS